MIFIMTPNDITVKLCGLEKFLALKSEVTLPADAIEKIEYSLSKPKIRDTWMYLRFPGTGLPGIILAGTFIRVDTREFWYLLFGKPGILTITLKKNHACYDKVRFSLKPRRATEVVSWWDGR